MTKQEANNSPNIDRYKMLFETAQDSIFLLNKENIFVDCNPYTCKMFNCEKEDIIGTTPISWSPELQFDDVPSKKKAIEYINKAFSGIPQRFEWIHKRKTGEHFYCEVSLNKVKIDNEDYLQAIVREITEKKFKEEVESIFSKIIDHDSRNIIFSVISYIELIKKSSEVSGKLKEFLVKIEENLEELIYINNEFAILRDVLTKNKKEILIIYDVVSKSIENYEEKIKEKKVSVETKVDKNHKVLAGKLFIEVIHNLIHNSLRHSNCKKIEIKSKETPNKLVLIVADDGKGISEEIMPNLFKEGIKGSDSKGTGLGLYITKKIINLYEGTITARNKNGGGAEFIIELPKAK